MALPRTTLDRSGDHARDRDRLVDLVLEEQAVIVVVGLPLSLDGRRGRAATEAAEEAEALRILLRPHHVDVELFDERLTTVSAHQALSAGGARRPTAAPGRGPGGRLGDAGGLAGPGAGPIVTTSGPEGPDDRDDAYDPRPRRRRGRTRSPTAAGPRSTAAAVPGRCRREGRGVWPMVVAGSAALVVVVLRGWLPVGAARGQPRRAVGCPGHHHRPVGDRGQSAVLHPGGRGGHHQLAGLPDLEPVPRRPRWSCPVLRLQAEQQLRRRRPDHLGRPKCLPPRRPAGLHRGRGGQPGGPAPRPHQRRLRRRRHPGDRAVAVAAGRRRPTSTVCWAPATYVVVPGETDTRLLTAMVDRFDRLGQPSRPGRPVRPGSGSPPTR